MFISIPQRFFDFNRSNFDEFGEITLAKSQLSASASDHLPMLIGATLRNVKPFSSAVQISSNVGHWAAYSPY
jgi:hypothetical protein